MRLQKGPLISEHFRDKPTGLTEREKHLLISPLQIHAVGSEGWRTPQQLKQRGTVFVNPLAVIRANEIDHIVN